MNTVSLALRNLLRNRRRSLTTLLAMVIGSSAILMFGGYSRNITYSLQTGYVQRTGHLQIQHKDYYLYGTGNPGAYGVSNYQKVIDLVRNDPVLAPMITVVTPTLHVGGIAGNFNAGVSRTVMGSGAVVDEQNQMRQWNDYQLPQQRRPLALTNTPSDSVVIGLGVARVLQLCAPLKVADCPRAPAVARQAAATGAQAAPDYIGALSMAETPQTQAPTGTRIEMLAANPYGAPNVTALNVVEASSQGVKELDDMYVGLHLSQAQRLVYGSQPPKVTAVVVQLKHSSLMAPARARLEELIATVLKDDPLAVQDFSTLNPQYKQIIAMFSAIFSFISLLIGTIVLFTVGNTLSTAVVERTVEIGTLRAIGLRESGIRNLFINEGLLLGVMGALVGAVCAILLASAVNAAGLTWTPPGQVNPIPLTIRVWGETMMIAGCSLGLLVVAALSAWWPARRAARMVIVDALRHV